MPKGVSLAKSVEGPEAMRQQLLLELKRVIGDTDKAVRKAARLTGMNRHHLRDLLLEKKYYSPGYLLALWEKLGGTWRLNLTPLSAELRERPI